MSKLKFFIISFVFIAFNVLYASPRRPKKQAPTSPPESTSDSVLPGSEELPPSLHQQEGTPKSLTVFLVLNPEGETQKVVDFLSAHPELPITIIFPPHYFDAPARRPFIGQFSSKQSSHTLEIALALDSEPNLALLNDLSAAGEKVRKWGFNFAWPEDVAAHIARASAKYQKRWGTLPAGLFPPLGTISEPVAKTVTKFRLNWLLGQPSDNWGIRFYGGMAMMVPPKPPVIDELTLGGKVWAEQMAVWTSSYPFVLIDTRQLEDPKAEQFFLNALLKEVSKLNPPRPVLTSRDFVESVRDEYELPRDLNLFVNDYSQWVATSQQKRAWAAIADARKVIETYQSSGRAKLQRLDAAVEEMCVAQSGEFLLNLGASETATGPLSERPTGERNFLATLANIYRLCETPVPPTLNTWFAVRTYQKTAPRSNPSDGPFFVEGANRLTWNDPQGDDNGAGKFSYPVGAYPKGLFDLKDLTISWTDSEVTISVGVLENFSEKPTPIIPLFDLYIDVNRLADAGSTAALRGRGKTSIHREAAWEYALALTPNSGVLYQYVPGGNPRTVSFREANRQGRNFSASFPRTLLRGNPKQWRLSGGLLGTENNRRKEEPQPASILVTATEKNFGGANSGQAAPFIDILDASIEDQTSRININTQGGPLSLPFVGAQ